MADNKQELLTDQDVFDYLAIADVDDEIIRNVERLIKVADTYLKGSISQTYNIEDERAKQIALLIISDLYDNRTYTEKMSANVRKLVDDMCLQMRLELSKNG